MGFDGVVWDSLVEVSEDLGQGTRDARRGVERDHVIGDGHALLLAGTVAAAAASDAAVRVLLESADGQRQPPGPPPPPMRTRGGDGSWKGRSREEACGFHRWRSPRLD